MKNKEISISTKKFIFVTGLTRSGKLALTPIICSMKNCEQFFFNTYVENLLIYNYLNLIKDKISKNLIIRAVNEEVYDKIYGRNLNSKKNDFTNLKKYKGERDRNQIKDDMRCTFETICQFNLLIPSTPSVYVRISRCTFEYSAPLVENLIYREMVIISSSY